MKEYEVDMNGIRHTFLLSDEDAKARGLKPIEVKKAPAPVTKARTPQNKSGGK